PGPSPTLLLPLVRTAYQTNERIDLAVVRISNKAIPAGRLDLTLTGADGGKLSFSFPVRAVPLAGKEARITQHLHVNAALLRPGKYTVEVREGEKKESVEVEVFSHLRKSSFRLVNWGRAKGKEQLVQGEDSLGFNLFYGHYGQETDEANLLRAGVDWMGN